MTITLPAFRQSYHREPSQGLQDLQQEVNRLFSFFGGWPAAQSRGKAEESWNMPLEIHDAKDRLVVKAELPGVKPEDINVSVEDNALRIRAERKHETQAKDENCYCQEIAYGMLERQIQLPHAVNTEGLQASYKNGILEISLPKREDAKPKQVKVQVQQ